MNKYLVANLTLEHDCPSKLTELVSAQSSVLSLEGTMLLSTTVPY